MSLSHLAVLYTLMLPGHSNPSDPLYAAPFDLTLGQLLVCALLALFAIGSFVWVGWLRHGLIPFVRKKPKQPR